LSYSLKNLVLIKEYNSKSFGADPVSTWVTKQMSACRGLVTS